mmetsp:Transcript_5616/g.10235  ORF Transcript_5616/g.10235 Transcript_5616/m.10235 type:complete len:819 (+) Transcript_5616:31-2487(+)
MFAKRKKIRSKESQRHNGCVWKLATRGALLCFAVLTLLHFSRMTQSFTSWHALKAAEQQLNLQLKGINDDLTAVMSNESRCFWKDLSLADTKLVVTSSHPISDGTAFLVLGDPKLVTCGDKGAYPARVLSLSDPYENNHFDIHRIDCPIGHAMRHGSNSCPALYSRDNVVPTGKKNIICLAPLYAADDKMARWLIEWMLYHQTLGFDHVVVPTVNVQGNSQTILEVLEKTGYVRIVPWGAQDTNGIVANNQVYEHGKLPAWNRCYLEYHQHAEWMLFLDIDEVLGVKTSLHHLLHWMLSNGNGKVGFSLSNSAILSVLEEPSSDRLLLDQYNRMEVTRLCPYNCGEFHQGRWKYFVQGSRDAINEILWTHSIQGLDYDRAMQLMVNIPEQEVAQVRHYQAHWYMHELEHNNLSISHFEAKPEPIHSTVLKKVKEQIDAKFNKIYKQSDPGLPWIKLHKTLPYGVLKMIQGELEPKTAASWVTECTPEQAECIVETFVGNATDSAEISSKIREMSACHHSKWIEKYYKTRSWESQVSSPFLVISVGCNKGYDAMDLAKMISRNPTFDKKAWRKVIENRVAKGLELKGAYCGADRPASFSLDIREGEKPRLGEFHCIEPMPATYGLVHDVSSELNLSKQGFVVTQAAMANISGTIQFPKALPAGEEAASIFMCNEEKNKNQCEDVPVYRLDDYVVSKIGIDAQHSPIDMLTIDAEGFDFDILISGMETLKRVQYLEFEYHEVGNWKDQNLLDATAYLQQQNFICYWAGRAGQLWRITGCTRVAPASNLYSPHQWSNIVCVKRSNKDLAIIMEETFLRTIA